MCLTPPAEGFPCDDLREIFSGCQRMANTKYRRNNAENLNRLSRAHERYRRQTEGRASCKHNVPPTNHQESCRPVCPGSALVLSAEDRGRRRTCGQQCRYKMSRRTFPVRQAVHRDYSVTITFCYIITKIQALGSQCKRCSVPSISSQLVRQG